MAKFSDIIGQQHIKDHLQTAIIQNTVSHAYIINGEKSSGKEFIANIFAMTLQCEKHENEPCLECKACKQASHNNHPDIKTIVHEKPNVISVNDVREQVVDDVIIKPYSGEYKVYIINDAETMTVQAQNALLKTIEEPPSYAVIILLTSNISALLETILSRCVVLNMRPVEDKAVRKYLMEEVRIPDYQADVCVAFARGNIGKARSLASSEDFTNIKNEAVRILKNIQDMSTEEVMECVKKLTDYKVNIDEVFDLMMIWYRDVLLFKATNDTNDLIFKDEIPEVMKRASLSTYEGIEQIIEAIEKAKARLKANVNFELTIELMLLSIKEN